MCIVSLQVHCVQWMLMSVPEYIRRVEMVAPALTARVDTGVFV